MLVNQGSWYDLIQEFSPPWSSMGGSPSCKNDIYEYFAWRIPCQRECVSSIKGKPVSHPCCLILFFSFLFSSIHPCCLSHPSYSIIRPLLCFSWWTVRPDGQGQGYLFIRVMVHIQVSIQYQVSIKSIFKSIFNIKSSQGGSSHHGQVRFSLVWSYKKGQHGYMRGVQSDPVNIAMVSGQREMLF